MTEKLKNIQYITIPENRKIGNFELKSNIPLPVEFQENQKPEDLSLNSIVAGLIKVAAYDNQNKNFDYYKSVLLEMQPDVVEELNVAAIAKSKKKEFDFALELMLAVNHLCKLPDSYINLAVLYAQITVEHHAQGDDVKADMYDDKIAEVLNECIAQYPDYAQAYKELSSFHLRHGDIESARDFLDKFIVISKDNSEKKVAQATLDKLNNAISSKDQILFAYDKMMMGLSDEALEICNKYIAANEPCWEAYFIRGWAKRTLEDFSGAQKDLLESLRLESGNAEVYNELSICAREDGNIELAKSYLDIASDLDPEDVVYLTNLAFLHLNDGEYSESRECIEKARLIDAQDPQLQYIMKQYQEKTGDKLGDIISQEVYSDEDFEELHKQEHENHHHHEEV